MSCLHLLKTKEVTVKDKYIYEGDLSSIRYRMRSNKNYLAENFYQSFKEMYLAHNKSQGGKDE